jgi:hypothetical protein
MLAMMKSWKSSGHNMTDRNCDSCRGRGGREEGGREGERKREKECALCVCEVVSEVSIVVSDGYQWGRGRYILMLACRKTELYFAFEANRIILPLWSFGIM